MSNEQDFKKQAEEGLANAAYDFVMLDDFTGDFVKDWDKCHYKNLAKENRRLEAKEEARTISEMERQANQAKQMYYDRVRMMSMMGLMRGGFSGLMQMMTTNLVANIISKDYRDYNFQRKHGGMTREEFKAQKAEKMKDSVVGTAVLTAKKGVKHKTLKALEDYGARSFINDRAKKSSKRISKKWDHIRDFFKKADELTDRKASPIFDKLVQKCEQHKEDQIGKSVWFKIQEKVDDFAAENRLPWTAETASLAKIRYARQCYEDMRKTKSVREQNERVRDLKEAIRAVDKQAIEDDVSEHDLNLSLQRQFGLMGKTDHTFLRRFESEKGGLRYKMPQPTYDRNGNKVLHEWEGEMTMADGSPFDQDAALAPRRPVDPERWREMMTDLIKDHMGLWNKDLGINADEVLKKHKDTIDTAVENMKDDLQNDALVEKICKDCTKQAKKEFEEEMKGKSNQNRGHNKNNDQQFGGY